MWKWGGLPFVRSFFWISGSERDWIMMVRFDEDGDGEE